ncbi:hypothetical protein D6C83_00122 [Aureobasidium pullulans]|uniref:Uncharacterized protein n=1 Tax=Aureobasidium pullulans TaxID=5580 RepID=A0A4T0ENN9_AURPU|nr:hypothetical protein D6C83_00122 [Aureobasidium pullulans]
MLTCFPNQQTFIGKTQRNPFKFSLGSPCPNFALLYQGRVEFGDVDMSITGLSSLPTYMISLQHKRRHVSHCIVIIPGW